MAKTTGGPDEGAVLALFAAIASRDQRGVTRLLDRWPDLAGCSLRVGATRQDPTPYFLVPIRHYVYGGDTALHVAAAARHGAMARTLVAHGAGGRARNRRGAEPLHYAADGGPGSGDADADGQQDIISYLIEAGAEPDAIDKSGVTPLHRAVRNRSSVAVKVLIDKGADPLKMNKSGSTPLHLAVQNTGKGHSGSDVAKEEQHRIIVLLLEQGAKPTDLDAQGKTVESAASSEWIRDVLASR
jgi:ankyrin repeat protein